MHHLPRHSLVIDLLKGAMLPIGTVRTWRDGITYEKMADGTWRPLRHGNFQGGSVQHAQAASYYSSLQDKADKEVNRTQRRGDTQGMQQAMSTSAHYMNRKKYHMAMAEGDKAMAKHHLAQSDSYAQRAGIAVVAHKRLPKVSAAQLAQQRGYKALKTGTQHLAADGSWRHLIDRNGKKITDVQKQGGLHRHEVQTRNPQGTLEFRHFYKVDHVGQAMNHRALSKKAAYNGQAKLAEYHQHMARYHQHMAIGAHEWAKRRLQRADLVEPMAKKEKNVMTARKLAAAAAKQRAAKTAQVVATQVANQQASQQAQSSPVFQGVRSSLLLHRSVVVVQDISKAGRSGRPVDPARGSRPRKRAKTTAIEAPTAASGAPAYSTRAPVCSKARQGLNDLMKVLDEGCKEQADG